MKMIGEILGLKNKKIYSSKNRNVTHYDITPYSFDEDLCFKLNSKMNIDLGQGILKLIKEIKENNIKKVFYSTSKETHEILKSKYNIDNELIKFSFIVCLLNNI